MSLEKTANVPAAIFPNPSSTAKPDQAADAVVAEAVCDKEVSDEVSKIFEQVAWQVSIGWLLGCILLAAVQMGLPASGNEHWIAVNQLVWVSLASGLITLASLVPGLVIGRGVGGDRVARTSVAIVSASAAMGIRFAGTVALFVACRYHFGEESSSIVFLVIGWYVFLTSIEVHGLARGCTSLDRIQDFGRRDS